MATADLSHVSFFPEWFDILQLRVQPFMSVSAENALKFKRAEVPDEYVFANWSGDVRLVKHMSQSK